MLRAASCQACKNLEKFLPPHSIIYIYALCMLTSFSSLSTLAWLR